jgi:hypothetical protein
VRQLVTESLLLAIAGGVAGLGVGYAGMTLFRQIEVPTDLPISLAFRMDRRALSFSLIVAIARAVIFGLVPAIQATRTDLTAVMKAGDSVAPGRRRRWGRPVLSADRCPLSDVDGRGAVRIAGFRLAPGSASHRPSLSEFRSNWSFSRSCSSSRSPSGRARSPASRPSR